MSAATVVGPVSLEEAIAQLINLGEKDPLTIVQKLGDRYGGMWIAEQLAANWEKIGSEIARQMLDNERRASIVSLGDYARNSKRKLTKRDVHLASLFIPSKGYISMGEATRDDLAEAAAYRRRLADGLIVWANWYDETRALMVAQGVERVRQVRGALPVLPSRELAAG